MVLNNETLGISPYIPGGLQAANLISAIVSPRLLVTSPNRYIMAHSCFAPTSLSVQAKAINLFPFIPPSWDSQSYRKSTIGHRNEFLFNIAVMV